MNRRSLLKRAAALTAAAFIAPDVIEAEAKKYFALDSTMLNPISTGPHFNYREDHGLTLGFDEGHGLVAGDILTYNPQDGRWAKASATDNKGAIITHGVFDGRRSVLVNEWMPNHVIINIIKIEGV